MDPITFDHWQTIHMKVGQILQVERVENADKLYKIQVDVGGATPIQIVSGLVPFYTTDELMHKKIIVLTNLKSTKFKGEVSQGMLLCAEDEATKTCVLLTVEKDIPPGTPIV